MALEQFAHSATFEEEKVKEAFHKKDEMSPAKSSKGGAAPTSHFIKPSMMKIQETLKDSTEEYMKIKASVNAAQHVKDIFSTSEYKEDIAETKNQKTPHSLQAMKYKLEAFTPEVQKKFGKNLTQFAGMLNFE